MTKSTSLKRTSTDRWEAADFGLQVESGDPDVRVLMAHEPEVGEGGPSVGFAKVAPSVFEVELEQDESIHVLEGSATIVADADEPVELEPGVAAFFPKGAICRWTVREEIVEFFSLSS